MPKRPSMPHRSHDFDRLAVYEAHRFDHRRERNGKVTGAEEDDAVSG